MAEEVSMCYQCGQLCEDNVTYCHPCFAHHSESHFRHEQRCRDVENDLRNADFSLQQERANSRRLQSTVAAFRTMLLKALHTDVTIETGDGDSTPAHRAVLASRSPVFNAMFEHELKEKTCAVIRVADVPTPAMRALLLYLYTGEHDTNVMKEHGMALLAAAHKYDIPELKKICESAITVSPSSALEMLQQARLYDATHLKKVCTEVLARNISQLAFTEEFRQFVYRNEDPEALLETIQSIARAR